METMKMTWMMIFSSITAFRTVFQLTAGVGAFFRVVGIGCPGPMALAFVANDTMLDNCVTDGAACQEFHAALREICIRLMPGKRKRYPYGCNGTGEKPADGMPF